MAELINLRQARKRAERLKKEDQAERNRRAHGEAKHVRQRRHAETEKAARDLAGHRLTGKDDE
jgi:hypothetical protein